MKWQEAVITELEVFRRCLCEPHVCKHCANKDHRHTSTRFNCIVCGHPYTEMMNEYEKVLSRTSD